MSRTTDRMKDWIEIRASEASRQEIAARLRASRAILDGHFVLHRGHHATMALKFRGVARQAATLDAIVSALFEQMPERLADALPGAKILSPETSGFFLGSAIARRSGATLAVSQTDLRRLPTRSLLAGSIQANERVFIVNDVAGTGASIDLLRELVAERHARLQGIILFGVVDDESFRSYCARLDVPVHWLVTAHWRPHTADLDCPGCKAGSPLVPIAEIL